MKSNTTPRMDELMKTVYWVNRYQDRVILLHKITHKAFMRASENRGSDEHLKIQKLNIKIYNKINVLARYSSLLTSQGLKLLEK